MNDDEIEQMLRGLVSEHLSGERQRHAARWLDDRQLLHSAMEESDHLVRILSEEDLVRELNIAKHVTEDEYRYDQVVAAARFRSVSKTDILIHTHKVAGKPSP